jgi:hypothetical protein
MAMFMVLRSFCSAASGYALLGTAPGSPNMVFKCDHIANEINVKMIAAAHTGISPSTYTRIHTAAVYSTDTHTMDANKMPVLSVELHQIVCPSCVPQNLFRLLASMLTTARPQTPP